MRYNRLDNLMRLALKMQARADGVSLDEIGVEFNVSRRTSERMRDALCRVFPQIEELIDPDRRKRWRLPPTTVGRMADPTIEDMSALNRGVEIALREGDGQTAKQLKTLSNRLRAGVDTARRRRMEPDIAALLEADGVAFRPGPREAISDDILTALREALLAGLWVTIDHRARASGKLSRNVELGPLAVLFGEGRQYLVAWSDYQQDIRLFALAGITRITVTNKPYIRPNDFDLPTYLLGAFGIYQEPSQNIVWRFTPEAALEAAHYLFHPSQTMQTQADGSLIVHFHAGGLREMAWYLFRWGTNVEVVEPAALRLEYEKMLQKILGNNENSKKVI